MVIKQLAVAIDFYGKGKDPMETSGLQHSSKYLLLCSTEGRNSDRFETT